MKHGKKPTRAQKKLMSKGNVDIAKWLVLKDTPTELVIVHRLSDKTIKVIRKE